MVLLPRGHIYFVELKSTGEKPTALQLRCHRMLQSLGFQVYVVDSTPSLTYFLEIIDTHAMIG